MRYLWWIIRCDDIEVILLIEWRNFWHKWKKKRVFTRWATFFILPQFFATRYRMKNRIKYAKVIDFECYVDGKIFIKRRKKCFYSMFLFLLLGDELFYWFLFSFPSRLFEIFSLFSVTILRRSGIGMNFFCYNLCQGDSLTIFFFERWKTTDWTILFMKISSRKAASSEKKTRATNSSKHSHTIYIRSNRNGNES